MRSIDLLSSFASIELANLQQSVSGYAADNDDPQLIFKLDEPLERGWYRADFAFEGEAITHPKLYLDLGSGFSEVHAVLLKPTPRPGVYRADFFLPMDTFLLRFDPTDSRSDVRLSRLQLKRRSAVETGIFLGRHALRVARRDPGRLVHRWRQYAQYARRPHFLDVRDPAVRAAGNGSYQGWIARHDFDLDRDGAALATAVAELQAPPLISVVMPVYNTPAVLLDEAIQSVVDQIYPHWELCIADDSSTERHVRPMLERWSAREPRIKVAFREANGHISHATNSAFALASGEWIAMLDHDDLLRPHALAEIALEIARHPEAQLIYSDEDKIDEKGRRYDPYFKPDFSRELFRSQNYLNHLTVHRADNIRAVGGWRPGFEGSQDYDLSLRIFERIDMAAIRHVPKVLYHWRAVAGSTAAAGAEKGYAYMAGLRALEEHVERFGLPAKVEPAPETPFYRLKFRVPEPAPLVSLIIPTRDRVELLRGCVESIRTKTTYAPYEILIVDNGSEEEATLAYFKELEAADNVRVLPYDKPFNYSAINNFAVSEARGSLVGLINNDIVVISPDWLSEMVSWAAQPDVGCVGAKLYYADGTIQHAGIILGIGGVAGHSHKFFPREAHGYFARLKLAQNLSAVTGACLLVRKEVYEAVNGLNETALTVAFNDVDFCLRVREAGYRSVWTPYAELYHLESVSRGAEDVPEKMARFRSEVLYMMDTWDKALTTDPFYSPHLTLEQEDFAIKA
ncbi:glycosyltransferase family 2 protein [Consotaella aegiceratis]|uniref:glycosyltransferase family 2 protein n=1 Tax=Consotaella aegiceratis TaxID=3097961 RepID=UPI002F3F8154